MPFAVGPIIFGLGAAALMAIAAAKKNSAVSPIETPPALPPTPPVALPPGTPPVVTPPQVTPPVASNDSMLKLVKALNNGKPGGGMPLVNALNTVLGDPKSHPGTIQAYYNLLTSSSDRNDPLIASVIAELVKRGASPTTVSVTPPTPPTPPVVYTPPSLPPVTTRTPGIWAGLNAAETDKLKTVLKIIGYNEATGAVSCPANLSASAIEAATAHAAVLRDFGHPEASDALRLLIKQASPCITVPSPPATQGGIPADWAQILSRAASLEGDPARLGQIVAEARKQPWASLPVAKAAIDALAEKARQLQALIDQAKDIKQVEVIQSGTYIVKKDDNPSKVAQALTGYANRWPELQAANPQYKFATQFWTGMKLKLPASWLSAPAPVTTPPVIPVSYNTPPVVPQVVPAPPQTYIVKDGDNPGLVAKAFTGYANRWPELQAANPQYRFTSTDPKKPAQFWSGMKLTLPASWTAQVSGVVGYTARNGGSKRPYLKTEFEQRGQKLYAHTYFVSGGKLSLFTVAVDLLPIAKAVAAYHKNLHGGQVSGCIGCDLDESQEYAMVGCVGGDCIEVGRKHRKRLRLGRAVKKLGRIKAIRKIGAFIKANAGKITKVALMTAAAIYPPVGVPAATAYMAAERIIKATKAGKALQKGVKQLKGRVENKLHGYAKKQARKVQAKLVAQARMKGLAQKHDPRAVAQAIRQATRKIVQKRMAPILKRAPALARTLASRAAARKLAPAAQNALVKSNSMATKLQAVRAAAAKGNPKALKAVGILNTVLRSHAMHGPVNSRVMGGRRPKVATRRWVSGDDTYYNAVGAVGCVGCSSPMGSLTPVR